MKDGATGTIDTGFVPGVSLGAVREVGDRLAALVSTFDPRTCDGALATGFVEEFARIERLAGAGKTLALGQVDRTKAWAHDDSSARSTAEWLAKRTGTPAGDAFRATRTAQQLDDLGQTEQALRAGKLSTQQAREICDAAAEAPGAESQLLELAGRASFKQLRDQARRAKAAAQDDEERAARQHAKRSARRWTDDDGMRNYHMTLTPGQAAEFEPTWDWYCEHAFAEARREGRRESYEAYATDALVELGRAARANRDATAGTEPGGVPEHRPPSPGPNVHALLILHATALRRGYTEAGETCEVAGIGPIDVAAARRLLGDAIIDILVVDGVDVRTVAHAGRTTNRRQKAALLLDWECEVRGCGIDRHLEVDHITPYAESGRTDIDDLGPKCRWHHYLKTHKGWRDGPRGTDGKRDLVPPDGPDPPLELWE
jgi:hypothetical protein